MTDIRPCDESPHNVIGRPRLSRSIRYAVMKLHGIDIPEGRIAAFCRAHGICRLSIYGSLLRDDFNDNSDVDILVEFGPEAAPSLLDLGAMQLELCEIIGRQVDLKTPEFLSPFVRERVRREARIQYAA